MCLVLSVFALFVSLSAVSAADCGVVTRKQWDGIDPVHMDYVSRPVDLVIIQHTGTPSCDNDAQCEPMVRNIQSYNMDIQKYWDLGSNFLIGGHGKVYEGPGWLHVGAHTYGYNKKSIGISFIGNFNVDEPQEVALQAAKDLIKCGVENGHLQSNYSLVGHRQLIATESPGRKIYNKIRHWPDWVEDTSKITPNL